jgi:epoxyqueuosine reductase
MAEDINLKQNNDRALNFPFRGVDTMFSKIIYEWSQQRGYRIGIGGIDVIRRVNKGLVKRKATGEIDPNFFAEYLNFIHDLNDLDLNHDSSLIVVAVPRSAHIVRFEWEAKIIEKVLPPTYVGYRSLFENVRKDLEQQVFSGQVRITTLSAPLKALASHLGIVSYGRNNLTYIPEFGSYFQLAGFLVDTPMSKTESLENNEESMLRECVKCSACTKACPMAVISKDRFLIHAEKCYTRYSESSSAIPSEMHPPSPNCIIGCMKCQLVCPANKGRLKYEDTGLLFSPEETHSILDSVQKNLSLPKTIEDKFSVLGLSESNAILFRNFRNSMR